MENEIVNPMDGMLAAERFLRVWSDAIRTPGPETRAAAIGFLDALEVPEGIAPLITGLATIATNALGYNGDFDRTLRFIMLSADVSCPHAVVVTDG